MRFKKALFFPGKAASIKNTELKSFGQRHFLLYEWRWKSMRSASLDSLVWKVIHVWNLHRGKFSACVKIFFQPKTISDFLLFLIQYLSKPPKTRWKCWLLSSANQATSSSRSDSKPNFDVKLILWPDQWSVIRHPNNGLILIWKSWIARPTWTQNWSEQLCYVIMSYTIVYFSWMRLTV